MKNSKTIRIILGVMLTTFIFLSIVGYSYAYFSLEIEGTGKDVIMSTADLRLIYKDDTELKLVDAMPGDSVSKVITVNNVGTKSATYSLYWGNLINTIQNFELHVTLECKSYINYGETNQTESGTCDKIYRAVPISNTVTTGNIKKNISIEPGITQEYIVIVKFDNKNYSQDNNINKTFTGKIGIEEYTVPEVVNCTFDGELTQGAEYVNGQYTYRYMQGNVLNWYEDKITTENIGDGWSVELTDKDSTDPVTSKLCTYVNDKPIMSMSLMFYNSKAESIDMSSFNTLNVKSMSGMFLSNQTKVLDLSSFETSNVTDMSGMFSNSKVTKLDLSNFDTSKVVNMLAMFSVNQLSSVDISNFNTSNVTNMSAMFDGSKIALLDLSKFDTSKVTNMNYMFWNTSLTEIDLSNFDTGNVTNMSAMFGGTKLINIRGLNNFNTSNVTDMSRMFFSSSAKTLDLSSFDTSNVTDMSEMFSYSSAKKLDLSSFVTSNVTDMSEMFSYSSAKTLDLSSFDTSKVNNMSSMFWTAKAISLDVSNFNTSKVTNMESMFMNTYVTSLDLSSFDTSNVINMVQMFYGTDSSVIYVSDKFVTDKVTNSSSMFTIATNLVGGAGTVYNSSNVDKTYARVDGGTSSPGYFTLKN